MNTDEISNTLTTLFSELVNGPPQAGAYMLNHGDPGLLVSLDRLSSAAASAGSPGGLGALGTPREVGPAELNEMIGSIAHLAYHLGAIRQIDRTARAPAAND